MITGCYQAYLCLCFAESPIEKSGFFCLICKSNRSRANIIIYRALSVPEVIQPCSIKFR